MGLLQNGTLHAQYPYERVGGTATAADAPNLRPVFGTRNINRLSLVLGLDKSVSFPAGYEFGNGWMPSVTDPTIWQANLGQAALAGAGAVPASNAAGGLNAAAECDGAGDIAIAAAGLIVSAVASLAGAGAVSAQVVGSLLAAASLSGAGSITAALGAIAGGIATLAGSGALSEAAATAYGSLAATIRVSGTALTADGVAEAVWTALAAQFNAAGTMGNKLNSASAAGDPWTAELPGTYAPGQAGHIVGNALSAEEKNFLTLCLKVLRNKQITDPATGKFTVYDDDGTTVLLQGSLFEDAAGTTPYRGQGAERREKLA